MNKALQHYTDQWKLSNPEPLAQTFTSDLYKVQAAGETAVLKILSETGAEDERAAADVLQWYDGLGAIQLGPEGPSLRKRTVRNENTGRIRTILVESG